MFRALSRWQQWSHHVETRTTQSSWQVFTIHIIFTGDPPHHCGVTHLIIVVPEDVRWRLRAEGWQVQNDFVKLTKLIILIKLRWNPPVRDDTGEIDGGATIDVQKGVQKVGRTLDPHMRNCNGLVFSQRNNLRAVGHWGIWAKSDILILGIGLWKVGYQLQRRDLILCCKTIIIPMTIPLASSRDHGSSIKLSRAKSPFCPVFK